MSLFVVDVESDGPAPGLFSMVSFGAIKVTKELDTTFKGLTAPISDKFVPEALAISNISREEHLKYPHPEIAIKNFVEWVKKVNEGKRAIFISDNLAFDWQFINYYCHAYYGDNPFGFSGRRIGDLYSGLERDFYAASKWKNLRKTHHTHDPVDDAKGNAEAILAIRRKYLLNIPI